MHNLCIRPSGVENVLQEYTQKLEICQRENIRLQEELSEVYTIKVSVSLWSCMKLGRYNLTYFHGHCWQSKFAELLKTETEKVSIFNINGTRIVGAS